MADICLAKLAVAGARCGCRGELRCRLSVGRGTGYECIVHDSVLLQLPAETGFHASAKGLGLPVFG